jgi:CheY-like chemotaxis protein
MKTALADTRPAEILHVDDDEGILDLTREIFKMTKCAVRLHRARNGEECMAFLRHEGKFADAPVPDLILLDLNMPRMDGREVMEEICRDEKLRHLPVVVLTTSQEEQEIRKMYQLRCSSYIVKPIDFAQFKHTIEVFYDYWLKTVVLPAAR